MAENEDQPESPRSTDGLVPPFLRRAIISPGVGVAVLGIAAVASIPFWHLRGPDVVGMASQQAARMSTNTALASDDAKPEAADPTSTPFPKRAAAPREALARVFHRPMPAPTAAALAGAQNVAMAQSVAVSQSEQPAVATAPPLPPVDTHSVFGDPRDTGVDLTLRSGAVPQVVVAQSGGVGYVPATSRYELREGTVIHCRWVVHADSEAIGHVEVQVVEPVYASNDPQVEVIPVDTLGEGVYSTANVGTTRFIVAWHRLNFPNGRKFEMGPQPATDLLGGTGANARVNSGLGKIFGSALLYTALNAAGQSLSRSSYILGSSSITQQFSGQERQAKPTLYIDPADRVDINVVSDLPLDRYEP